MKLAENKDLEEARFHAFIFELTLKEYVEMAIGAQNWRCRKEPTIPAHEKRYKIWCERLKLKKEKEQNVSQEKSKSVGQECNSGQESGVQGSDSEGEVK